MTWETAHIAIVVALAIAVFIGFLRERLPPDVVAMIALSVLLLTGVLESSDALTVFSNSGPITVACMFVLSAALERTGVIEIAGTAATKLADRSAAQALVAMMLCVVGASAFMNNTPVVVVLTPVAFVLARAIRLAPSCLLIPLSYASILGGMTTLVGTSTNLLVNGVIVSYGLRPLSMFEISGAGLILAMIGICYIFAVGRWLLPVRETFTGIIDNRAKRAFLAEMLIPHDSPLIGKHLRDAGLTDGQGSQVIDVLRGEQSFRHCLGEIILASGDRIVLRTNVADVIGLRETGNVLFGARHQHAVEPISSRSTVMMEGIVGPQSRLIGYRIADLNFRRLYGVYILALHRQGEDLGSGFDEIRLSFGDTLLLEGPSDGLRRLFERRVLVNLTEPTSVPFRRDKAPVALGAILLVMGLAAFEVLPIVTLALAAATAVVALGCLTADEAYAAIQWRTLNLIFGMLGLGLALEQTGTAAIIVDYVAALIGAWGPWAVLAVLYLLTSILTEVISNNAAAILMTPIAIGLAQQIGVDPRPFAIAVLFAASASFATPIGYQTNTFVYNAGGYRFTDFVRIGLPLNLLMWASGTLIVPMFWPF
ncbi:SLC13 family permease [Indioceanicola profundi]|uniref:SLC13 family permease n=1 Tax=Indioceanicola profundi TaxID=2220096 RepID=UPI000E6AD2FD|nr:SLC13 family permease [Indioceanicola profundi]